MKKRLFGILAAAGVLLSNVFVSCGSAGSKGMKIYLSGADTSKTWNVWAWNDEGNYSSKAWPGGDIQLVNVDSARGLIYTTMTVDTSMDMGILFVDSSNDQNKTSDINVPASVLSSCNELYFNFTSKNYFTSYSELSGIDSAEISGESSILVKFLATPSVSASDFTVKGFDGTEYEVTDTKSTGTEVYLTISDLNLKNTPYTVTYGGKTVSATISPDLMDQIYVYDGDDLGLTLSGTTATFKCWAPIASSVSLLLYTDASSLSSAAETVAMTSGDKGVWSASAVDVSAYKYYKYRITNSGTTYDVSDIWSVCASGDSVASQIVNINDGTSAVVSGSKETYDGSSSNYVNPFGSNGTVTKNYSDAVIYEMHIRDWSRAYVSDSTGKFQDITDALNKDSDCFADYLNDLGITHVQILPMFDYSQKNSDTSYNWGYNPYHYNVPEGRYVNYGSEKDGTDAVLQMRQMIESFHNHGIAVVMDVVYNHTSGTGKYSLYDMTVPEYFYRLSDGSYTNGSGCGNEVATNHDMVRKYVIDSLKHWMLDYHINGFRFDLMGCLESSTMAEIYSELSAIDCNVLVYGEPWTGGDSSVVSGATAAGSAGFGAFDDSFRDAIKGSEYGGFGKGQVQGSYSDANILKGLKGSSTTRNTTGKPELSIHYVECHDNYTLFDKLSMSLKTVKSGSEYKSWTAYSSLSSENQELVKKEDKLAAAYVFLSQGTPFINGGQEFLRTKEGDGDSYAADTKSGKTWSETDINRVNTVDLSFADTYADVYNVYRGLIHLRQAYPSSFGNITTSSAVTLKTGVTKYEAGDFVVYFNATDSSYTISSGTEGYLVTVDDAEKTANGFTVASEITTAASVPAHGFVIYKKN